jgi:hypothetical protein
MRDAAVEEGPPGDLNPGVRAEVVISLSHAESELRRNAALSEQAEQDQALLQACGMWIPLREGIDQPSRASDVDGLACAATGSGGPCQARDERVERNPPQQRELNG